MNWTKIFESGLISFIVWMILTTLLTMSKYSYNPFIFNDYTLGFISLIFGVVLYFKLIELEDEIKIKEVLK